jgi:hypothetical protein
MLPCVLGLHLLTRHEDICKMLLRRNKEIGYVRLQAHVQFMLDVLNTSYVLRLSCS